MHLRYLLAASAASVSLAGALATPAMAQETTSTIAGTVLSDGQPVAGAQVEVLNTATGGRSTATSSSNGSFTVTGLRPGGPYTVTVRADGFADTQVTEISTVVAQSFNLPVNLVAQGDAIIVTASRLKGAGSISRGPATVLSAEQIANVATVNRDLRDLMRRDPFARLDDTPSGGRAVSFAGQNARFNRFTVDGVPITDNFGLNPDGLPSRRSPIPLDAIGQFQTVVAPDNVRDGNFQGGVVNVILRSGTNDFQGTGFFAYSADELSGKRTKAGPGVPTGRVTLPNYEYKNYGAELSGPIVKDKVFFMIAGERIRAPRPIAEGPSDNNAGSAIPNLTQAQVDQISSIASSRYGYTTGGVVNANGDKDDRLVGKLDFNISDTQRLSVTGTYAKDQLTLTNNTSANVNSPQLGLASNAYISGNELWTAVAQLNSDWSDNFSTEVRGFYKDYKRIQDPLLGRGFAQMRVCTAPTSDRTNPGAAGAGASVNCQPGSAIVSFGPDVSRQTNALNTQTWGGLVQARLTMNDHDVRFFTEIQHVDVFNAFLSSSSPAAGTSGAYYFDSIADFQAGNAQRFGYINAVPSLNPDDASGVFSYMSYTFGIQDNWRVNDMLSVSYGARYDLYGSDSRPALNPAFTSRIGYPNTAFLSGRGVFQPRFGFTFTPMRTLNLRGSLGIISGGTPDVYLSNSFSNTGILSNLIDITQNNNGSYTGAPANVAQAALTNVNGSTIPTAVNNQLVTGVSAAATNATDPKFEIPSQWRASLSADWTPNFGDSSFGRGWTFGADLLYSAVRNQVFFTDARSVPTALTTPDGRVRYRSLTSFDDTFNDIILTNTKKGRSYVAVARIRKEFDWGLNIGASYTYQDIKDQTPATSSTAGSNYANGAFLDANGAAYGISNDEVKHNIKYDLTFDHAFFGDYKTTFALFGETRIGRPYSYTFQDTSSRRSAIFGTTGSTSRYLIYVPTGIDDPRVSYDSASTAQTLDTFFQNSGLAKYRGQIAPRNAFNSKWFTRIDLHVAQEIPVPGWSKSRIQLFADIENFTNFLNRKWGQIREYQFSYTAVAARVACLTAATPTGVSGPVATNSGQACAQYRYSLPNATPSDTIYAPQSLYTIRVGARFSF
ncbi:outer membrane receptor protein involved in Fe transport [Novosphingobium fluoreni]|uniref:Outer membrane receptor protein involved in Fe transport n=1 Tax=Novosphingobium fluoreni TaxID=1391222 RepID=A0A7W6BWV7_9SPHN|nr:carboxypeptidase regulatory-like domain-containing protein [Novosphingobium fluoreni]MBB3939413.1 outer membrane receptor protein involved in Fe transport [Novosphingobium fluoreni]